MIIPRFNWYCLILLAALADVGCGRRVTRDSAEWRLDAGGETVSGASYKNGRGVHLEEDLRKQMGLETADVSLRSLTNRLGITVQAYRLDSRTDPSAWQAVGLIQVERVAGLLPGQEVLLRADAGVPISGRLRSLIPGQGDPSGEKEVVIDFNWPISAPRLPTFLRATWELASAGPVMSVPRSALLQTVEGEFVYAVNGNSYQRTAVKLGAETADFVEIADGLLEGDVVVVAAVEALYQIETQAVRGGDHCH